ncbi:dihydroorotate dehydrogenase [Rhodotorula kratochvilovae]
MPLFPPAPPPGAVPVFNSACPWASSADDLKALWECPYASAVTTRTCTLNGFEDDQRRHQVAFFGPGAESSANSYGYSPYPLSSYLSWLRPLLASSPSARKSKQLIVSITGPLSETATMLSTLQSFATEHGITLAAEFNASCPNIPGHPPPAYVESELRAYVALLAEHASPTLKVGIKLPPYTYDEQFAAVVRALSAVSTQDAAGKEAGEHPISFLTATNTLGQGLVFAPQIADVPGSVAQTRAGKETEGEERALPGGGWGGLAGAAVHQLALGNIARLALLLRGSPSLSAPPPADARLKSITLIGVGGAHDAAGVERFRRAGADAVACATALGREGTGVFEKMAGGGGATRAKL